jgi:hypothetical protein
MRGLAAAAAMSALFAMDGPYYSPIDYTRSPPRPKKKSAAVIKRRAKNKAARKARKG